MWPSRGNGSQLKASIHTSHFVGSRWGSCPQRVWCQSLTFPILNQHCQCTDVDNRIHNDKQNIKQKLIHLTYFFISSTTISSSCTWLGAVTFLVRRFVMRFGVFGMHRCGSYAPPATEHDAHSTTDTIVILSTYCTAFYPHNGSSTTNYRDTQHVLYCLLPPQREQRYELSWYSAPTVLPSTPTTGAALWTKTAST